MSLEIQLLSKECKKENFLCGKELLDNYLHKQANQDVKRDLSACYVLVNEEKDVLGYYTLSSSSIDRSEFPDEMIRKLPKSYEKLPTILLGRLAVDNNLKGKRYGEALLYNALERCLKISDDVGALAVQVDPIDEEARNFYRRFGFAPTSTGGMYITIATVKTW